MATVNPVHPHPMRPRLVVTTELTDHVMDRMRALFDVDINMSGKAMTRAELERAFAQADVVAPTITDVIDAALIANAGPNLKLIANFGVGVDHIDLPAARARGIIVTNTPGVLTEDTADMAMALILSVPRRLGEGEKLIRQGEWAGWKPSGMLGHRVNGKILGIVGMGRIGRAVAMRAKGFGISTLYHNRHRLPEGVETELGATFAPDLDILLGKADQAQAALTAATVTRVPRNFKRSPPARKPACYRACFVCIAALMYPASSTDTTRKPAWLRAKLPSGPGYAATRALVDANQLHTVCQSAQCPNLGECWSRGTATVMILGNICTRSCNFCAIATGRPTELDLGEPARVADAVARMNLKHCVITSVARDELADGGASVWAATIRATSSVWVSSAQHACGAVGARTDPDGWWFV